MRGDLIKPGFIPLCSDFPPSINTATDPSKLQNFESPEVYSADINADNLLKTGSLPTKDTDLRTTYTINSNVYSWIYNRLWIADDNILLFGSPNYTDAFIRQGLGEIPVDSNIIYFNSCLSNAMIIVTEDGSYIGKMYNRSQSEHDPDKLSQEFYASNSSSCIVVDSIPYVSNDKGLFGYDGQNLIEVSRPVRYSPSPFASSNVNANFTYGYLIGDDWAVDIKAKKLFDYSKSFSFTSRTLTQEDGYPPFTVDRISFQIVHLDKNDGTISWQVSYEEGDWVDQDDVTCSYQQDKLTRIDVDINSSILAAHKFRLKITYLSDNIAIRSIDAKVSGLAIGSFSE